MTGRSATVPSSTPLRGRRAGECGCSRQLWSCGCPVLLSTFVVVRLGEFGQIGVVVAERWVVGVLLRRLGTFRQQPVRYLVDGAAVFGLRRRFLVADEFAVGVDAECGERRPLQRV